MKTITLTFKPSTTKPADTQEGKKFLLCWSGWQYGLYRWSVEHNNFYDQDGKDYLEGSNPYQWAQLPDDLNV